MNEVHVCFSWSWHTMYAAVYVIQCNAKPHNGFPFQQCFNISEVCDAFVYSKTITKERRKFFSKLKNMILDTTLLF